MPSTQSWLKACITLFNYQIAGCLCECHFPVNNSFLPAKNTHWLNCVCRSCWLFSYNLVLMYSTDTAKLPCLKIKLLFLVTSEDCASLWETAELIRHLVTSEQTESVSLARYQFGKLKKTTVTEYKTGTQANLLFHPPGPSSSGRLPGRTVYSERTSSLTPTLSAQRSHTVPSHCSAADWQHRAAKCLVSRHPGPLFSFAFLGKVSQAEKSTKGTHTWAFREVCQLHYDVNREVEHIKTLLLSRFGPMKAHYYALRSSQFITLSCRLLSALWT